ncbi:MAG: hypothetical protein UD299_03955 [Ruminococcus sp.]|nr:hypothetical protein [Ruminococcus sp.]
MFDKQNTRELNEQKAREYGKRIVDLLAAKQYKEIISAVDEIDESKDVETFEEDLSLFIEWYLDENQLKIEPYDTTAISDADEQERFFYNDEDENDLDFSYEYDLQDTDLTLMLDFIYEDGKYIVIFVDVHQLQEVSVS